MQSLFWRKMIRVSKFTFRSLVDFSLLKRQKIYLLMQLCKWVKYWFIKIRMRLQKGFNSIIRGSAWLKPNSFKASLHCGHSCFFLEEARNDRSPAKNFFFLVTSQLHWWLSWGFYFSTNVQVLPFYFPTFSFMFLKPNIFTNLSSKCSM